MPHQCTNCEETFPDGSKEMLSGCPRCGGNTFQYLPEGSQAAPDEAPPEPPQPPGSNNAVTETVAKTATSVRDYVASRRTDESQPSSDPAPDPSSDHAPDPSHDHAQETPSPTDTPAESGAGSESAASSDPDADLRDAEVDTGPRSEEDNAQASARGEIADSSELPDGPLSAGAEPSDSQEADSAAPPREDGRVVKEPDSMDRPDLETLREELNDQFESIKILEPGQYELNLMELYDREEHIIALREDGKYIIEVPETWRENRPDPEDE